MTNLLAQAAGVGRVQSPGDKIVIEPGIPEFKQLTSVSLVGIIQALIGLVLIAGVLIFFFMLVLGGIRWITAGGNKERTESARNQLTSALIGIVIVLSAWGIIQFIQTFFGIEIVGTGVGFTFPTVQ